VRVRADSTGACVSRASLKGGVTGRYWREIDRCADDELEPPLVRPSSRRNSDAQALLNVIALLAVVATMLPAPVLATTHPRRSQPLIRVSASPCCDEVATTQSDDEVEVEPVLNAEIQGKGTAAT